MSERWLIIRNGAVGDTVLLSSVVAAVKQSRPEAWVEVMGGLERVWLLVGDGLADCAVSSERPGVESLYGEGALNSDLYDYFAEFTHILIYTASASQTFVDRLKVRNEQWVCAYPALPDDNSQHITEFYLNPVRPFVGAAAPMPAIHLYEEELVNATAALKAIGIDDKKKVIGVHPGAGSHKKTAPPDRLVKDALNEKSEVQLLITQGPADGAAVESFINMVPTHVPHCVIQNKRLRELAAMLSHCERFVGNDSGVTHIAAALGVPTTVFFIASDPAVWAPLGDSVKLIETTHL